MSQGGSNVILVLIDALLQHGTNSFFFSFSSVWSKIIFPKIRYISLLMSLHELAEDTTSAPRLKERNETKETKERKKRNERNEMKETK
jgi:hypothetical protein